MRVAFFSTQSYEREFFENVNQKFNHDIWYFEARLTPQSAALAQGFPAVCAFVNDIVNEEVLKILHEGGTYLVALRSAGFNNVDIEAANHYDIAVVRVPEYSPNSVAEFTVAMMLALDRKIYRAYNRVREGNFSLEGLMGFDLKSKTVGIIGTGRIGTVVAQILSGFSTRLLGYDMYPNDRAKALGVTYTDLSRLYEESDVITLHCPLTPDTYHLLDRKAFSRMKDGVMIINTGRGALINTLDAIEALKNDRIGYLGLDVYEEESAVFYRDLSNKVIKDDVLARLLTFPNVLITSHQGFFTREAVLNIAETTLRSITEAEQGQLEKENVVTMDHIRELAISGR